MRYTGTVLGGPHDGDIITIDGRILCLPELLPNVTFYDADAVLPPTGPSWHERIYRWTQDDDGRGWWLPEGWT